MDYTNVWIIHPAVILEKKIEERILYIIIYIFAKSNQNQNLRIN